jgi:ASC-1-like (ASCH) protein
MSYYKKYIKYKTKYMELKNNNIMQNGGKFNTYNITVKEPWFSLIKNEKKTVEGRLNRGLFKRINVGDVIVWVNKNIKCTTIITYLNNYSSFRELLEKEGLGKVLPTIKSVDAGVNLYHQYFSEKDEEENGVVAIGLKIYSQEHILSIQNPSDCPVFDYIKQGTKKVEGRPYKRVYKNYNVGDILVFLCNGERLKTTITDLRYYDTLEEYLEKEGFQNVLPCKNVKNMDDAINIYNRWSNEKKRNILKKENGHAFVAIEIKI